MRILIALEKKEAREILSFSLESRLGARIFPAQGPGDAIEQLSADNQIQWVISQNPSSSQTIAKWLADAKSKVPMIVCSSAALTPSEIESLSGANVVATLIGSRWADGSIAAIEAYLKIFKLETQVLDEEYVRIRPSLLLAASPLEGDVYVRLNAEKLVKLFRAGDPFDPSDYEKYVDQRGIEFLFLRKEDVNNFVARLQIALAQILASEPFNTKVASEMSMNLHQTVCELINEIGPTVEVQSLVKTNMQLTTRAIGRNPRLKTLISKITEDPQNYISSHSVALTHLACAMACAMEWGSETTFQKLNMAAFLHDITLSNPILARIHSLPDLDARKTEFTAAEVDGYPKHPIKAAELARRFEEIPTDADTIILQHHELPEGNGFPRGLGHRSIAPLSALFIIAHDLVHVIYEEGKAFKLEDYVERSKDRFGSGPFRKILACLSKIKD